MGICIVCEKEGDECQCGKAAQKRLRELIAEARRTTDVVVECTDGPPEPDEIDFNAE